MCVGPNATTIGGGGLAVVFNIVFLHNRLIFVQSQNMLVAKRLVFILVLAYLFFDIYVFRWHSVAKRRFICTNWLKLSSTCDEQFERRPVLAHVHVTCTPSAALIMWGSAPLVSPAGEDPLAERKCDLDSVAGVLKLYFRSLESPLVPIESTGQLLEHARTFAPCASKGQVSVEEFLRRPVRFLTCFFFVCFFPSQPLRNKERGRESSTAQSSHLLLPRARRHCHAIPLCFSSPVSVWLCHHMAGCELFLSFGGNPAFSLRKGKEHNESVVEMFLNMRWDSFSSLKKHFLFVVQLCVSPLSVWLSTATRTWCSRTTSLCASAPVWWDVERTTTPSVCSLRSIPWSTT